MPVKTVLATCLPPISCLRPGTDLPVRVPMRT
jgi:hypothetical protein